MLAGSSIAIVPTHYEYLPEKQQQAHNFLKQVTVSITHKENILRQSLLHYLMYMLKLQELQIYNYNKYISELHTGIYLCLFIFWFNCIKDLYILVF